jgi:hypothetical protein
MVVIKVNGEVLRAKKVGNRALVKPCPEIFKILEDVFTAVFGDQAVVWQDGDGGVPVDEGDEEGGYPVGVQTVACYLAVLLAKSV